MHVFNQERSIIIFFTFKNKLKTNDICFLQKNKAHEKLHTKVLPYHKTEESKLQIYFLKNLYLNCYNKYYFCSSNDQLKKIYSSHLGKLHAFH